MVGPALVLSQSITAIITKIKASDWGGAYNELLNIPANMTNAFLNGGPTLDLTSLIPKLGLPSQVKTLGLAMGGVLSPGGSLFNSLDTSVNIGTDRIPIIVNVAGVQTGPIGSLMGVGWEVASAIGWDRNGNPLHPGIPVPGAASRKAAPSASAVVAAPAAATASLKASRTGGTGNSAPKAAASRAK